MAMRNGSKIASLAWLRTGGMLALAMGLADAAAAQTTAAQADATPAEQAGEGESGTEDEIVVTGSRIARAGFDQPTPTLVLGDVELRQGARPNIQQILNDQPQFRQTTTPQVSNGNTSTGTASLDLRGLGTARTLVLIDGRRFVGENNLNYIPIGVVERLEVVTGSASAAWGSNAVAGVVNVIIKDDFNGFTVGGQSGISSRGDGFRYGVDGTFGTDFADGRGRFMIAAEYVDDKGIPDRNSRRNLGSPAIVRVNPLSTTDLSTRLTRDVNFGNQTQGGLITTGVLAGQVFESDGSLRPFRGGMRLGAAPFPGQMVGGEDGIGLFDTIAASTPFSRLATYGRLSYDLGGARVYIDASYGRVDTDDRFVPDFLIPPQTIQATNPFLSPAVRARLAAAGQTSFTLGRFFDDILFLNFKSRRENKEGAIGIEGDLGNFKYNAYFSHGEIESDIRLQNSRIAPNFARAINAVSSGGQIVCAVNADAITTNDDPACRPLNPFGRFNASPEARDYVTGTQRSRTVSKLDAAGVEVQGDLFTLPAGPLTVVVGAEARWEEQTQSRGESDRIPGFFGIPLFTSDVNGGFNVKEGFAEVAVPVIDADRTFKLDLNGAARYSDFSNSGGIWSWKVGGTARLFDALLLRAARSRDIRSPGIGNLFLVRALNVGPLVDQDTAGRTGTPGFNATPPTVSTFSGGNPDLVEETSRTLTVGGSFSPSFIPRLNLSVDYYDIKIDGAIVSLSGSNLTLACSRGNLDACSRVVRNPTTGTVETVFANFQNVASIETSGFDMEASYLLKLSDFSESMPGSLRLRALATHVRKFVVDTGVTRVDTAGDVGDSTINGIPKWRGTFSATYQDAVLGFDVRVLYVDGGKFNRLLTTLVNNDISSRTYVDLGAQFKVRDQFTLFGNVNNLFDVAPPITSGGNPHYDIVGTYFTAGARVNF